MLRISCETWLVIFGTLVSILLRACTTLHPYSGEDKPPMYGDYEAQRHWMEITINTPIEQWYYETPNNNLTYWGLDYPPLTAYHMALCGFLSQLLNPKYVELNESRGFQSDEHKFFMRNTVLFVDVLVYIPAIIYYFYVTKEPKNKRVLTPSLSTILALLYPGIILIDHGHFQYNCVSLGFFILATTFLLKKQQLWGSLFFCLALNYKQMELYHALPFFIYLLSICVPKYSQSYLEGLLKLSKLSLVVLLTFGVIWAPFLNNFAFLQVTHRLFPVARGVFEDKVSNFWCLLNVIYKIKLIDNFKMMRICLFVTITALFPSSIDLFLRPNLKKFVLSLINSSLAFYLFSFQVHEKTILLVAIPVLLYFPQEPFICFWFLCLSTFSMVPLFIKDGLFIASFALSAFYVTSFFVSIEHFYKNHLNKTDGTIEYYRSLLHCLLEIEYKRATAGDLIKLTYEQIIKNKKAIRVAIFHSVIILSLIGCAFLSFISLILDPPSRFPDLFPLLVSSYSAIHFVGFFIYFNVKQIQIPQDFDIKNEKVKLN